MNHKKSPHWLFSAGSLIFRVRITSYLRSLLEVSSVTSIFTLSNPLLLDLHHATRILLGILIHCPSSLLWKLRIQPYPLLDSKASTLVLRVQFSIQPTQLAIGLFLVSLAIFTILFQLLSVWKIKCIRFVIFSNSFFALQSASACFFSIFLHFSTFPSFS